MTTIFRKNLWSPNLLPNRNWIISRRLKWPERKAYRLFSSRTAVFNAWIYSSNRNTQSWQGVLLRHKFVIIPRNINRNSLLPCVDHSKACNDKCRLRVKYSCKETKFYETINNNVLTVSCLTYRVCQEE